MRVQTMVLGLMAAWGAAQPGRAAPVKIPKADFPAFVGVLACGSSGEECPGAAGGFVQTGLAGQGDFLDPSASELTKGGRILVGFPEGKFSWNRYSVDFPSPKSKWVVLNELSSGEQNRVFLSLWKSDREGLELVKVFPRPFPLALGETFVLAKGQAPGGGLFLLLKGEGSESGLTLQDYRVLRLSAPDNMEEWARRTNRSEIAVKDILDKLNADQAVPEVLDSALACDLQATGKRGPRLRCIKSRHRVLYTKAGPRETPAGKDTAFVDLGAKNPH